MRNLICQSHDCAVGSVSSISQWASSSEKGQQKISAASGNKDIPRRCTSFLKAEGFLGRRINQVSPIDRKFQRTKKGKKGGGVRAPIEIVPLPQMHFGDISRCTDDLPEAKVNENEDEIGSSRSHIYCGKSGMDAVYYSLIFAHRRPHCKW